VDEAARRQAQRLYAKRDRRIFGNNRFFARANLGHGWRGTFPLRFRRRDLPPRPSQPDRSLSEWIEWTRQKLPIPESRSSWEAAAARSHLACIRQVAASWPRRLAWAFRGSPNRHAFCEGHRRRNRDQPVASPVALFERRRFGLVVESVLLLEAEDRGDA
jgi:hypothetical protein